MNLQHLIDQFTTDGFTDFDAIVATQGSDESLMWEAATALFIREHGVDSFNDEATVDDVTVRWARAYIDAWDGDDGIWLSDIDECLWQNAVENGMPKQSTESRSVAIYIDIVDLGADDDERVVATVAVNCPKSSLQMLPFLCSARLNDYLTDEHGDPFGSMTTFDFQPHDDDARQMLRAATALLDQTIDDNLKTIRDHNDAHGFTTA
jgi:hypothetical protein